jgi:CRP/FNR family cyclic AMP-dependent transcriptional regulator
MFEMHARQPLLSLDPDLGQLLGEDRRLTFEQVEVAVASVPPGFWRPEALCPSQRPSNVGLLVVSGVCVRAMTLLDSPSAELFGAGDIIRTWRAEPATHPAEWQALERTKVAVLDSGTALALRAFPEVMAVVLDRLDARAERLAVTQAISQLTGVENRIEALLWHLSQRWGRVGRDGVIVGPSLSHRMIGALVGARRPTVSTAIARLSAEGRVQRHADGRWLLTGSSSSGSGAGTAAAA